MIVDDLDVVGIAVTPTKANPPLVVDPDAVLSFAVASQGLQSIAGRCLQIAETARAVDLGQLAVRCE